MKTVSIIIAVYNEEKRIKRCVSSVCEQSYRDLEIIIVDDGSTDSTPALVDEFAEKDNRIQVIHKENGGISSARNTGLAAAKGDFICWLDSDDWMESGMIESLVQAAEENNAQIALTNYQNIYSETDKRRRYQINGDIVMDHDQALHAVVIRSITQAPWGNIAMRSLYEGICFPDGKLFEDVRVMYRIFDRAQRIILVDKMQMNRLNHKDSLSSGASIPKRVESCESYLERWENLRSRYPQWQEDFIRENYRMLLGLRHAVIHSDAKTYRVYQDRIRVITDCFRKYGHVFPGKQEGLFAWLEHSALTSGTRMGFFVSLMISRLSKERSFLNKCTRYKQP